MKNRIEILRMQRIRMFIMHRISMYVFTIVSNLQVLTAYELDNFLHYTEQGRKYLKLL